MATILIIDDNEDYRTGLAELLHLETYESLQAQNGLVGIAMIRLNLPDLILCDLDMPFMDGMEVLRKIKTDAALAGIPFFMITAVNDAQNLKIATELGVDAYLVKPLELDAFLSRIANLLNPNADTFRLFDFRTHWTEFADKIVETFNPI